MYRAFEGILLRFSGNVWGFKVSRWLSESGCPRNPEKNTKFRLLEAAPVTRGS